MPHKDLKFSFYLVIFLNVNIRLSCTFEEHGINGKPLVKAATFHFPEYAYKETSKNEITYHDFEQACEQNVLCVNLGDVNKLNCIRRCISPSCYQDIYAFDELENDEIDVRMNSFKGCVIQRMGNRI